ncbi:MAG: ABC transporter ATP-binding protein, partial [Coriobacteriia bacterium]|nr:ABC transporter ATP-binding protein [Coriobacteriia bacterium]
GNRLLMMREGEIIFEASGQQKKALTVPELVNKFISAGVEVLV